MGFLIKKFRQNSILGVQTVQSLPSYQINVCLTMKELSIFIIPVVISLLTTLFGAWIFARVFQVKQLLWYQQKQLDITMAMAAKAGVPDDELNEIINREV